MTRHPLAIAAGMLLDAGPPADVVEVAARAGFWGVGLRFVGDPPTAASLRATRRALDRTGLVLLDLEMSVLRRDGTAAPTDPRALEIACELAPRHLTTVSYLDDDGASAAHLAAVCDVVAPSSVVPALEHLPFSGVRTFEQARAIVDEVGRDRAAVLVDALHVERAGDDPGVLAGHDAATIPYVQLCDAPRVAPGRSDRELYEEAVAGRLLPGSGGLPLERLLAAIPPAIPLSLEVLSRDLEARYAPLERAVTARRAAEALLDRAGAT